MWDVNRFHKKRIMKSPFLDGRTMLFSISIILVAFNTIHGQQAPDQEYCKTVGCRINGLGIRYSLNNTIHPCNDFYQHVCSGWIDKLHPVDATSNSHNSQFYEMQGVVRSQIYEILESKDATASEVERKARRYYESCKTPEADLNDIIITLIYGGEWPLITPIEKFNALDLDWKGIHDNILHDASVSTLLDVNVEIDPDNTAAFILSISVPNVPWHEERVHNQSYHGTTKADYVQNVVRIAEIFRQERKFPIVDTEVFHKDLQDMIEFEDKLAAISYCAESSDKKPSDYRVMTIEELEVAWNLRLHRYVYQIDWQKMISDRFFNTDVVISREEKVVLRPATFIEDMVDLLSKTSLRTMANYMQWKMIHTLLPFTNGDPDKPKNSGVKRSADCVQEHKMVHAIGHMYVKKNFDEKTRSAVTQMTTNIRDEMKLEISDSTWLDDKTKAEALKKIDAMDYPIGYPEWYDTPGKVDEYYSTLEVGANYLKNVIACNILDQRKKLERLRTPVSKNGIEWIAQPHVVTSEYNMETNALTVPAAILQRPMFLLQQPTALNYAAIGSVIGHEIFHGFGSRGREYDANGRSKQWWTESSLRTYESKAQCFIDQYNKYTLVKVHDHETFKTIKVNGTLGREENMADTVGFRTSLRALRKLVREGRASNVKIKSLDNLNNDKLFFYGLSHVFCESIGDKALARYETMEHSPNRIRVNGALSNIQEFSDTFNCAPGTPMNPVKKCLLWD